MYTPIRLLIIFTDISYFHITLYSFFVFRHKNAFIMCPKEVIHNVNTMKELALACGTGALILFSLKILPINL